MPFSWPESLPLASSVTFIFTMIVIALAMQFAASKTLGKVPVTVPFMIPFFGHYITFCYQEPLRWIEHMSSKLPFQVFATYIWGRNFYIFSRQDLIEAVFADHGSVLSFTSVRSYLLVNIFGAKTSQTEASSAAIEEALSCFKKHTQGGRLSGLISRLVQIIQEDGPNLVSFSNSVVDESSWERLSSPKIVSEDIKSNEKDVCPVVEVELFALIRNFVGLMTIRSLMGFDWADSQPTFVDVLWSFDEGWRWMLMRLPRWLPIPGLSRAYIARRNLCKSITSFHQASENHAADNPLASIEDDFDDVSQLFKDRFSVWRAHHTTESVKAPADLSLLWAATVKPGNLIFWMLLHIHSSPTLASDIRLELSPYVTATQPRNVFGIPEPSRLRIIDLDGLSDACPLLKAVFYESLRLHSRPLSVRKVTKSFSFSHTCHEASPEYTVQPFEIESGAYLVAPFGPHDSDLTFNLGKFLSVDHDGKQRCNDETDRPWGLGEAACPGRIFAEKQVFLFVSAIVLLWDIEPTNLRNWERLQPSTHHVMARPTKDCRALVRARKLG